MTGMIEHIAIFLHKVRRKLVNTFGLNGYYYLMDMKSLGKIGGGVKAFGPCHINSKTEIGDNTAISSLQVIGHGDLLIGKHCHLGWGLTVITSNHNWKGNGIPYDDINILKPVHIGDFVWIGANVTILPGVTIGEGAIIQAGSVVRDEIPPMALAGGNPAEVFSWRDKEHFDRMKAEERFF